MFIGDTSACIKASGLPFIETAKIPIYGHFLVRDHRNQIRTDRNPLNLCADCGQVRLAPHPDRRLLSLKSRRHQPCSPLEAQLHTILARVLDRSRNRDSQRGAECRRSFGEACVRASCY
jgi:hypothetical protein